MALELRANNPAVNIEILGVNRSDQAAFNLAVTPYHTLSWLQDTNVNSAWAAWQVTWRDLRILDESNWLHAITNLTSYDLGIAANYNTVKQILLNAARAKDADSDGLADPWEMLFFGNLQARPDEDPDYDGSNNADEYSFGTHPNHTASRTSIQPMIIGTGSQRRLAVAVRYPLGSALNVQVQASDRVAPWVSVPENLFVLEPFRNLYDGTGTGRIVYGLNSSIIDQPNYFIRVQSRVNP